MTAVHEHTSAPIPELTSPLTSQEQEWVDQFMDDTTLFLGPDRDIMRSHHIASRTEFEDHPEPDRRRHLVRLWLRDHGRRAYTG